GAAAGGERVAGAAGGARARNRDGRAGRGRAADRGGPGGFPVGPHGVRSAREAILAEQEPIGKTTFPRVTREPRLSDKVAHLLLETIHAHGLQPGERLPSERELGEQFGVSRTVIREAVRALAAKGVIDVRTGSGLRVAAVDRSTVSESMSLFLRGSKTLDYPKVHEVRAMLEVEVAGLAAVRASRPAAHDGPPQARPRRRCRPRHGRRPRLLPRPARPRGRELRRARLAARPADVPRGGERVHPAPRAARAGRAARTLARRE